MLTLVTGANGHIGCVVVRKLLARGRRVRAFVRRGAQMAGLTGADGGPLPGLELAYGDILDKPSLLRALRGAERVFHLAAVFKTRLKDEAVMIRANVEGTEAMMEACAEAGSVKRIVYTSSVAAVGCRRQATAPPLTEADWNTDPIDAYVASKTESEHLARQLMRRLGLDLVVVNPATVLGPFDWTPTPSNDFIRLAMQKSPPVWFEGGHSYVDVEDVAEGHLLAEEKGRHGGRYILSGENISNRDLFEKIARLTGGRRPFIKLGHAAVEVLGWGVELKAKLAGGAPLFKRAKAHKLIDYYGYFDASRARAELGFRARPLDEILPRCKTWCEARGWLKA